MPRTPHRAGSLAWAGWFIARLGGWLSTGRRFPGEPCCLRLAMIGMVEASVERAGKTSRARRTYLGSAPFARAARAHRGVENRLHRVLDVVFHDDLGRPRTDTGPADMATIRHAAFHIIKAIPTKALPTRAASKSGERPSDGTTTTSQTPSLRTGHELHAIALTRSQPD